MGFPGRGTWPESERQGRWYSRMAAPHQPGDGFGNSVSLTPQPQPSSTSCCDHTTPRCPSQKAQDSNDPVTAQTQDCACAAFEKEPRTTFGTLYQQRVGVCPTPSPR